MLQEKKLTKKDKEDNQIHSASVVASNGLVTTLKDNTDAEANQKEQSNTTHAKHSIKLQAFSPSSEETSSMNRHVSVVNSDCKEQNYKWYCLMMNIFKVIFVILPLCFAYGIMVNIDKATSLEKILLYSVILISICLYCERVSKQLFLNIKENASTKNNLKSNCRKCIYED